MLLGLAVVAPSCDRSEAGLDGVLDAGASCVKEESRLLPQNYIERMDYLFVVENSPQMAAMLPTISQRVREAMSWIIRVDRYAPTAFDLHVGVITSDLGAGLGGAPGCAPWPGQDGRLQALGAAAPAGCKPPVGAPYIEANLDPNFPRTSNLPDGQDLFQTLDCMLALGGGGCQYPQPLEAVRRALRDAREPNAGFLRDDAVLMVVFIGTHDDCSAPPDTDLFIPDRTAAWGPPGAFRCTRAALQCGPDKQPPTDETMGSLEGCEPRAFGPLYDLERYRELLTNTAITGGIKDNWLDVVPVLFGGPPSPVSVVLGDATTPPTMPYECHSKQCAPLLQRSCSSVAGLAAEPAVRFRAALEPSISALTPSFCDDDWIGTIAPRQVVGIGGGSCLPSRLTDSKHPVCEVVETTWNSDGTTTWGLIPDCLSVPAPALPCWRAAVVGDERCGGVNDSHLALFIDRRVPAPDHTTARLTCAVRCGQ